MAAISCLWLRAWSGPLTAALLSLCLGSSFTQRPQRYRRACQLFPAVLLTQASLKRNPYSLGVNSLFSSLDISRRLQKKEDKIKTE